MATWPAIEPTTSHLTYLLLSLFLILYALFSELIRNRFHLSEPPLATLVGILFGPRGFTVLDPISWGWLDNITQELTRIIVGVQVFAVGLQLPAGYMLRHVRSITLLLGPNMVFGWVVSSLIVYLVLRTSITTALITGACLTPTDPVLSASVLGEASFSHRIPTRIRQILAAESGCNDGTAFPFLYAGVLAVTKSPPGEAIKSWFLDIILWQCTFGIVFGVITGLVAKKALRFSDERGSVQESTLLVFYFLLAIFTVGLGSTLGLDDFLVAFSAGTAFCWDGWFVKKTHRMQLPSIIDLLLNSTMFVYFGAIIPWDRYKDNLHLGRMVGCVVLILLLRRIPAILAFKRWTPEFKTYPEALFGGHFGPMGVGAMFLAMEARARLETGTSGVLPHPPKTSPKIQAIETVWPVVCFIVLGSIMIHGFSALVMSIVGHLTRHPKERAPLLGTESDRLYGMADEDSASSVTSSHEDREQNSERDDME